METKEIQKLIDFINQSGLAEVDVETSDIKLSIKRFAPNAAILASAPVQVMTSVAPQAVAPAPVVANPVPIAPVAVPVAESSKGVAIKSPMIGTFYNRSKPDAPAFVNVGDEVKAGQVLCIIEAMKLFNEIESEISGRIVKVLVDDKTPVEFDQPLFLVEPA